MKYVLSDIHGNHRVWESIKSQIQLKKKDDLYILGDVIDRGEYGIEILQEIFSSPNMHLILGNHEYMMLNALGVPYVPNDPAVMSTNIRERTNLWYYNGGKVTHEVFSYLSSDDRAIMIDRLKGIPLSYEVEVNGHEYVLCHANSSEMMTAIANQNFIESDDKLSSIAYFAVWDRDYLGLANRYYKTRNKIMIFGHTPTNHMNSELNELPVDDKYLSVFKNENVIGIDCGAGWGDYIFDGMQGRLSCIRLDDMKIFYSRY